MPKKVSSVIVPYASYLRVYEPLAAFPEPERGHWARYARRRERPSYQDELRRSLADLLPTPPIPVPVHESGDAFVLDVEGVVCVCPWRTRLRGWQALGELAEEFPAPVLDAVLPPLVRRQAAQDYERWLARNPDARPWIRTSTWQVPLNWFVLVSDEERKYEKGAGEVPPVLRYRTPMVQARRRVARGLRTLKDTIDEGPLIDGLLDVGRWLEEFHPRSLVELDYGGLVHVLPAGHLDGDHSAADVAAGIEALRIGDGAAAGEAYGRLVERWRSVRDRRSAN
ncbi:MULTISPECIES: hypothetical protein [Streptomyces]|uniref:DUF8083 domain-containing protein n=2 Tax=Streptomyces avermitilis TaxID=33903 RepID=Q82FX1_STRAW|nr:hypothetical protein [Streptomyces avermitilis]MYS99720.1 hypothetical protein [Streptomyces sp. SID5469]KUN52746.1 hypothetical protein AQJ43_21490 [Streptomyces avermitilis]OOV32045.1 hypothetical protein SM007_03935 [Streptomyces avermitilis]BAC71843.1 hypothetical protein SAVERM_4131 [Streptomyces avermitilis MA-4680 = NBRC 14893]GDY64144.1 hypothetical protein SAV14893_035370 [Streptomyces avermitilis]